MRRRSALSFLEWADFLCAPPIEFAEIGGCILFETSFARASQNGRRQFRELAGTQTYGTFLRRLLLLRLADRLVPKKVAKATAAVTLLFVSFYDSFKKIFQWDFAIIILTSI